MDVLLKFASRLGLCAALAAWVAGRAQDPAPPPAPESEGEIRINLVSPGDYEVVQRPDGPVGAIPIEGSWSVPKVSAPPEKLDARLLRSGGGAEADPPWTPLPFDPRARGFRTELPAACGGWYQLQVRAWRGGRVKSTVTIPHVGVGEVFVVAGQSNSANYGESRQVAATGLVAAFDGQRWAPANDPQPGATGNLGSFLPSFGDALAKKYGVPVGLICLGVGSTSVREWLPRDAAMTQPPTTGAHVLAIGGGRFVSSGELFSRLAAALARQPRGGVRALLWHQGESDWNQASGHAIGLAEYAADLATLIAASRRAAGWDVPWFVAEASYHTPGDRGSAAFRAAQHSVVDGRLTLAGPDTDQLGPEFRSLGGRGVHFNAAGLQRHGQLWAEAVEPWIAARLGP